MSTPDIHLWFATRALTKARSFVNHHQRAHHGQGGQQQSSSLSKSPNYLSSSITSGVVSAEINRRDDKGRTVLHLACSETDAWAIEWVELVLAVNGCQVNAQDDESGWTALHRALYVGNIAAAKLLLARQDIDQRVKDHEGLTPYDLYNSTVEGTNPSDSPVYALPARMDLLTWGANRNYVLGFAGDSDRTFPERVALKRDNARGIQAHEPVRVRDVAMARLHSAIVTDEPKNNVRLCGYGTGGRLGQSGHTMFTFTALKDFPHTVSSVVLSPDHTVIVTASGGLWTFGTNRFSQLGYTIDTPSPAIPGGVPDEAVQMVPRKVLGALKKEVVVGAAASRTHTVAYTADSLFTWGTNKGQLGYALPGSAVQLLPRKVTAVAQPVIMATATENATACLLESRDVVVLWQQGYVRIAFPMSRFPTRMQVYHPPQFSGKASITKITSCGSTFAALSSHGDVFTFSFSPSATGESPSGEMPASARQASAPIPQRIWSLRRKFTAVTDIAVGLDGTVILSTVSGHVFVRTKKFESAASAKSISSISTRALPNTSTTMTASTSTNSNNSWKFARVPHLQRVVKVAANSTGGFAAIRYDVPFKSVDIEGASLAQDLAGIMPHWKRIGSPRVDVMMSTASGRRRTHNNADEDGDHDDEDDQNDSDAAIKNDVEVGLALLDIVHRWEQAPQEWESPLAGSDSCFVTRDDKRVPVHRSVIASRSGALATTDRLDCSLFTALLFVHYLYTDSLIAIWDSRIGNAMRETRPDLSFSVSTTKAELQALAQQFYLEPLSRSLLYHSKNVPSPSLSRDVGALVDNANSAGQDVVLVLSDREVRAHSDVLRARCPFFETMYEETDWTAGRAIEGEPVRYELDHVAWDVMRIVLTHIYTDAGVEMFRDVERASADDFIDYVMQVMAVANELMLDKLKSVCSAVIGSFVTLNNVCSILSEAAFYEATDLARACMLYMACSMETLLEGHFVDDLPADLLAGLSAFVQERQSLRLPMSRSNIMITDLLAKHAKWLAEQDIPRMTGGYRKFKPVAHAGTSSSNANAQGFHGARSPGPSPSMLSPDASPAMRPLPSPTSKSPFLLPQSVAASGGHTGKTQQGHDDEPFSMDDFSLDAPASATVGASTARAQTPRRSSASVVSPSSSTVLGSPPPPRLQPWSTSPPSMSTSALGTGSPSGGGVRKVNDLKSIMAHEAAAVRPATKPIVQRARPLASTPVPSAATSSTSSWKPVGASWQTPPSIERPSISSLQAASSSSTSFDRRGSSSPRLPPGGLASTRPLDPASAIGAPVFTPTRSVSSTGASTTPNRSFSGADVPWTNYGPLAGGSASSSTSHTPRRPSTPNTMASFMSPTSPSLTATTRSATTASASTTTGMSQLLSLASIQSEQQAQDDAFKSTKAPRSFADLMKADESAAKARAEEEAFARWWEEESRRVQKLTQDATRDVPSVSSANGSAGGGRRGDNRGKGRKKGAQQASGKSTGQAKKQ